MLLLYLILIVINFKLDDNLYDEFDNYIELELELESEEQEEYEDERRELDVYRERDSNVN